MTHLADEIFRQPPSLARDAARTGATVVARGGAPLIGRSRSLSRSVILA